MRVSSTPSPEPGQWTNMTGSMWMAVPSSSTSQSESENCSVVVYEAQCLYGNGFFYQSMYYFCCLLVYCLKHNHSSILNSELWPHKLVEQW